MGSFNGHNFSERGDGGTYFPTWDRTQEIAVRHVPGGSVTVIQDAGRTADMLTLDIYVTTSELAALFNDVGTSGSLVFSYGTRTAYLESVSNAREVRTVGRFFATLKLVGQ